MTKNDRAIAVAQDVLEHLDELELVQGHHIRMQYPHRIEDFQSEGCDDLRGCVDVVQHHCDVCLKGAAVLSKARIYDGVPMSTFQRIASGCYANCVRDVLLDVFDGTTLDLMEIAFEGHVLWYIDPAPANYRQAIDFGHRYYDNKERVRAVMENVIANGGVFIP